MTVTLTETEVGRCAVVTIAVAVYDNPDSDAAAAGDAGDRFASLFDSASVSNLGHIALSRRLIPRAIEADVRHELTLWGSAGAETGVLLWTGHCELDAAGRPRVRTSDTVVAVDTLGDWITRCRFRRWVVIVDGCFAGSVIDTLYSRLNECTGGPDQSCVLIASADSTSQVDAGRFTAALVTVLSEGTDRGWWSTTDRFIDIGDLVNRLDKAIVGGNSAADGTVTRKGGRRWAWRIFPNPLYRPRSTSLPLDEAHFLPKARGTDAGEIGWFFTGRTQVLRRIVTWLSEPGGGFFVVTGAAGTGKSAVVGRVVTLSVPEYRRVAEEAGVLVGAPPGTVPPEGAVTAAFHARERRVDELIVFLADSLGIQEVRTVKELVDAAKGWNGQLVFAIDALDEATAGHARRMVDEVLVSLASGGDVKVLIGTRAGVVRWDDFMRPVVGFVDLSFDPDTPADITDYSTERLLHVKGSSYTDHRDLARRIAEGVTMRALSDPTPDGNRVGSFLVARLLTKTLAARRRLPTHPGWQKQLPSGFDKAFEADLTAYESRLGPPAARSIRAVLEGLAWDEGSGLPRRVIPVITEAVTGQACDDNEVTMVLQDAAGHLLEGEVNGWAVYRLYHERLREHLRSVTTRRQLVADSELKIHGQIADALIRWATARNWDDIDPYLAAILPRHAQLGGRTDALVMARGYLEHAEPRSLLDSLPHSTGGPSGPLVRAYRRASHAVGPLHPDERRLALELATVLGGGDALGGPGGPLSPRWVRGLRGTLLGTNGWATATAVGVVQSRSVVVSAGNDGTLRVWDLAHGEPTGGPLTGHIGAVRAITMGMVEGRAIAVSGGGDGTVRLWDLAKGEPTGDPLTGHMGWVTAVALAAVGDMTVAISGGMDATIRMWDISSGAAIGQPLSGHVGPIIAVATGIVDRGPVAISGGYQTLIAWDVSPATQVDEAPVRRRDDILFTGHVGRVTAVALGEIDGRTLAISGSSDTAVRVWDATSGAPVGKPLSAHSRAITAVALGVLHGRATVVSGSTDSTVRIWDLSTGVCIMTLPALDQVRSLAIINDGVLIAAGSHLVCVNVAGIKSSHRYR